MRSEIEWVHNAPRLCTPVFSDSTMSLKKTDLAKNMALKISMEMKKAGVPNRFGTASTALPDRREQRKLDQAAGLVPFAVKLHHDLIKQLQERAQQEGVSLNELTERFIRAGMGASVVAAAPLATAKVEVKAVTSKTPVKAAPAKKAAVTKPLVAKADKPVADKAPAKKAVVAKKAVPLKAAAKKVAKKA